ncbi:unnamed protein product [Colias eurytheme]|nr:unnamed protein product [Colias eurytheme]
MELLLRYLVLTLFWKMSSSIRCYICVPEQTYEGIPLCQTFNGSDRYLGDCKHSTMCFKRETSLDLGNGKAFVSISRGCAAQTMSGNQEKINGKWTPVDTIYDAYDDGCQEVPNLFDRPTKTLDCYCRGDLCNSSYQNQFSFVSMLLIPLLYFLR